MYYILKVNETPLLKTEDYLELQQTKTMLEAKGYRNVTITEEKG